LDHPSDVVAALGKDCAWAAEAAPKAAAEAASHKIAR
jgi:hypothetical protein